MQTWKTSGRDRLAQDVVPLPRKHRGDELRPRKRVSFLVLIMSLLVIATFMISAGTLYRTAIKEETLRLTETAKSQVRLIEAIALFNKTFSNGFPHGARQATPSQIKEAHSRYKGLGETGEFTLSKKENDQIVFLLSHRHHDLDNPKPVPWDSKLAEPMRLALSGKSGMIIGNDYRGKKVLAAYEPVDELNLGIVAKIDLSEVREPFLKAAFTTGVIAVIIIALGVSLFLKS